MQPFHFLSCSRTDTGMVRDHNEDAVLERPRAGLWAVADGMGGHSAGDLASGMVVRCLEQVPAVPGLSGFVDAVEDALAEVNRQLRELASERSTATIGSTVAAVLVRDRHAVCLWAGDSRIYRLRGRRLEQVSHDHALVSELLAHGVINAQQAATHPHGNLITRAVGAADDLHLDLEMLEIEDGDLFLLCSDGLDKEVEQSEILEVLGATAIASIPDALVALALGRGARDNVSVVAVKVDGSAAESCSLGAAPADGEPGEDTLPDFTLQEEPPRASGAPG